ncbi:MAG: polymer-forming cytoskeletal protein [Lachnospiraceae bacterium]|nr:polymer-forming cytoskeletal protein [Lachnospiraceae bacterium]
MGFFSDLREDLAQAVNEMVPEEGMENELENTSDSPESSEETDLGKMLENLTGDDIPTDEEKSEDDSLLEEAVNEVFNTEKTEDIKDDSAVSKDQGKIETESVKEEESKEGSGIMNKISSAISNQRALDETSVIGGGMSINGDITTEGSLEIVGSVNGNIDVQGKLNVTGYITGNSKASEVYAEGAKINGEIISEKAIKIGASTVIIGNISAQSAVIAGAVKGDIDVKGPVVLDASAIVMGNIKSKSVQINNGAVIEGMCSQCYADVSPTSFFDDYKPENKKSK